MSISVQQSVLITLNGDGVSPSFVFDFSQPPVAPSFSIGYPSSVSAKLTQSPDIQRSPTTFPWQASTTYPLNAAVLVITSTSGENDIWIVTTAGTSGGSKPSQFFIDAQPQLVGATVQDGTVVWTNLGNAILLHKSDNVGVTASIKRSAVSLAFSSPLLLAGSTLVDAFGNGILIGTYAFSLTFYYNG